MTKKCLLDMDGVIADFVGGACKVHKIEYPYNEPEAKNNWDIVGLFKMSNEAFWKPMEEEFWANLEFTPEAKQILSIVEAKFGLDNVCLLTNPSPNLGCIPGKIRWIQKNIPQYSRRFLCGPKKEFCAHSNSVLIDDNDDNIKVFTGHGGRGIIVPRPWNSLHPHESKTIEKIQEVLETL